MADPDEWDDKAHAGTFDSTLLAARWAVAGGSARTLTFQTHYRHEAGPTAQVLVSCNGAAPTVVKTCTADALARAESLAPIRPPPPESVLWTAGTPAARPG
ncbi:hypothetical protein [Streptomyces virginiae]|uniref:hypothetical protein n=1 Tax=Streptomyces virginiae TaxID=1961 RepID=UPI0036FF471D